jgi:hypothetical protein
LFFILIGQRRAVPHRPNRQRHHVLAKNILPAHETIAMAAIIMRFGNRHVIGLVPETRAVNPI